jgi:hypothetical protein
MNSIAYTNKSNYPPDVFWRESKEDLLDIINLDDEVLEAFDTHEENEFNPSCCQAATPKEITDLDILCGRDKICHSHVGNKHFRRLVESYRLEYQNARCRDHKTQITCSVIEMVHRNGGRFLKLDENAGIWEEVDEQYAREKVSHALRSAKDPSRPRVKKQRRTKEYVPSEEENALFQEALEEQQRVFRLLMENYPENVDQEDSSNSEYDLNDWDFDQ